MARTLRKSNGQFNGSVGEGARRVPATAPPAPSGAADPATRPQFAPTPANSRAQVRTMTVADRVSEARDRDNDPALLAALARDRSKRVRENVARNPSTPAATLAALAADDVVDVRVGVAVNRAADATVLERLAHDDNPTVVRNVATNPSAPEPVLRWLGRATSETYLRVKVAQNPATPPDLLNHLASGDIWVRQGVAANPSTPNETLRELVTSHDDPRAAWWVARNPRSTATTLAAVLAVSDGHTAYDEAVAAVAAHPNVTVEQVGTLAIHSSPEVRAAARENAKFRQLPTETQVEAVLLN